MNKPTVDILIIALNSPILVGVYKNNQLIQYIETSEKTSDCLPIIFKELSDSYKINHIYFTKGPGSFMAIKLVYVFLKTVSIVQNIKLFATDGFLFSTGNYIKAHGECYFVKKNEKIELEVIKETIFVKFELPKLLDTSKFSTDISPMYILPAIN
ncbi:MAG: hypothetical protein HXX81_01560 [Campylobacterales bacterium]|nr:hypothetical protein [Campylobacterales bacterium]